MLVEGLAEKTTETNMQIDRADKLSEGFVDQVFEPTAVIQWLRAYSLRRLIELLFQQRLSLEQGRPSFISRTNTVESKATR
jgi:hypothetical protein